MCCFFTCLPCGQAVPRATRTPLLDLLQDSKRPCARNSGEIALEVGCGHCARISTGRVCGIPSLRCHGTCHPKQLVGQSRLLCQRHLQSCIRKQICAASKPCAASTPCVASTPCNGRTPCVESTPCNASTPCVASAPYHFVSTTHARDPPNPVGTREPESHSS